MHSEQEQRNELERRQLEETELHLQALLPRPANLDIGQLMYRAGYEAALASLNTSADRNVNRRPAKKRNAQLLFWQAISASLLAVSAVLVDQLIQRPIVTVVQQSSKAPVAEKVLSDEKEETIESAPTSTAQQQKTDEPQSTPQRQVHEPETSEGDALIASRQIVSSSWRDRRLALSEGVDALPSLLGEGREGGRRALSVREMYEQYLPASTLVRENPFGL